MQEGIVDRRKEPRFTVGAPARLRHRDGGACYDVVTVNVSGGGLLLRADKVHPFQPGEEVACELRLDEPQLQSLSSWGLGRVVRVQGADIAVELQAGVFVGE